MRVDETLTQALACQLSCNACSTISMFSQEKKLFEMKELEKIPKFHWQTQVQIVAF